MSYRTSTVDEVDETELLVMQGKDAEKHPCSDGVVHGSSAISRMLKWMGGVLFVVSFFFLVATVKRTAQNHDLLPQTCLSEFSTAPTWTEFVYRTASVRPEDRCDSGSSTSGCLCANPFEPEPRNETYASWPLAMARNLELIASTSDTVYDVVLFGDSITEHWLGTNMAIPSDGLQSMVRVYHELFDGPPTSPVRGLALGISGDRTSQLMYRLLHGEVSVSARVYWILIGINDFLAQGCTKDMIIAGAIQSVETLLASAPNRGGDTSLTTTVVVSSILPWGRESLDIHTNPNWNTIRTINHALECYTDMRRRTTDDALAPRIEFFNATQYFLTDDQLHVNATYMIGDMLHPSAAGRRVWGAAISARVQAILAA